ncbi:MAG: VWA domain-containing protein [Bacteroidetes bacterium]|nr:VWA domain-containing protein [Bacteroidota bacterium]
MLHFEHSNYFILLAILPVLIGLFIFARWYRKKAIQKYGDWLIMQRLMPEYSGIRPIFKAVFLSITFIFLVIGIANPQMRLKLETVKREGVEIMIALDISNSMMAEDIAPNRLEQAKLAISQLIKRLHNDKIGLVIFAGQPYVQLPLTTDYSAARMFLSSVNTSIIPIQGTAIGAAIELCLESFDPDTKGNKALIIISDGENHEDDAIEQAKVAKEANIQVHTIGIGSSQGVPIPVYSNSGRRDFRRDPEGNVVITKLNETMMQQIAGAGDGSYVRAANVTTALKLVFDKINELEKEEFETAKIANYESWFQIPLALALFFLVLEFLILPRKNRWLSKVDIFKIKV